jgi:hypothetical protein
MYKWCGVQTELVPFKMTTWAGTIRHPWFLPLTMKRRLSTSDDDDDYYHHHEDRDEDEDDDAFHPRKRARHGSLERTLAHMTLGGVLAAPSGSGDVDMWPRMSVLRPSLSGTLNAILPASVEEPVTPPSEENVDMEVEPTRKSFSHVSAQPHRILMEYRGYARTITGTRRRRLGTNRTGAAGYQRGGDLFCAA